MLLDPKSRAVGADPRQPLPTFPSNLISTAARRVGSHARPGGIELRRRSLYPEEGSVGVLRWCKSEFVDSNWLMKVPRTAWLNW